MRKSNDSQSAFFNPRIFAAFLLCSAGAWLAMVSFATPSPTTDTLTTSHNITYTDSTGAPLNPTPIATGTPTCGPSNALCSVFTLNIGGDVNALSASQYQVAIQWQWGVSTVDYDWFVEDNTGAVVAKNQSTADPSSVILPLPLNNGPYKLIGTLSTGAPIAYTGTVTVQPIQNGSSGICSPPANCTPPRYQNYPAAAGQAENSGEPSLGVDFNPNVPSLKHDKVNTGGVAFFTSGPNQWRVNFDDCSSPAVNLWEDVSAPTTQQFVLSDPIGFVDHYTSQELGLTYPEPVTGGREFTLDLIGGQGNSLGSFSDVDGNSYVPPNGGPGGTGGAGQGPDHETLGGGPYAGTPPATASYPATAGTTKTAIYYCSQNIVAEAQCSRSEDGGKTFGPGVPIFNPTQCTGGIHGHVKVAPDGTVYVPNSSCGTTGTTGVAVSTDNGVNWTENNVANSTSTQDPSLGIGQNHLGKPAGNLSGTNTIYLGYADGDGHAKVAHSGNRGATWSTPVDVGAPFGVTHAVFPVVVAGDDNRAAFAFLGTGNGLSTDSTTCDPYGATLNCANIWHLYVATTYDGGGNWITVDATPNDPVQQGTVCLQGTTCAGGRNLLDFNDFAIDAEGRGLVGYADGCVNCANTFVAQSNAAHGTVARQSGGRRLFSHFDPAEPTVPGTPQLVSANRDGTGATIVWLQPDNGGSPITSYDVYRGASGNESFLVNVPGETTTKYFDPNPPQTGSVFYYVLARNPQGPSPHCPEISLGGPVITGTACTFPYLQVAPAGTDQLPDPSADGKGFTIQSVNIGEPFLNCSDNSITYVMKVAGLDPSGTGTAILPQNAEYQILFNIKDTTNTTRLIYVELDTFTPNSQALPGISIGRRDPCTTGCGTLDSSVDTTDITASWSADGTIVLKVNAANPIAFPAPGAPATGAAFTWNPSAVGTQMTNIIGNTFFFAGAGAGFLETICTTSGNAPYARVGNQSCSTAIPIAALTGSPQSAQVNQTVNFDGTGSHTVAGECGTINSYTIDYADNTGATRDTQTNNTGHFTHAFTAPGEYSVRLTVTDSNGKTSTNLAQQVIEVTGGVPPLNGAVSRRVHSSTPGATTPTFDINLPLTGTHGIECRSGAHNVVVAFQEVLSSVSSVTASAVTAGNVTTTLSPSGNIVLDSQSHKTNQYNITFPTGPAVPNASHVSIILHGVTDAAGNTGDITIPMDVLLGDVTANGKVDGNDVSTVQGQVRAALSSSNFRDDVTANGKIDGNDVSTTQGGVRTRLP
jgi:hypothetical protein